LSFLNWISGIKSCSLWVEVMEAPTSSSRRVRAGLFEIDLDSGEVHKSGRKVPLQEQPFRVLAMLLERPGEVITREELQARLWPADTFVGFDEGINTTIRKLRVAFGDSADNPRFIETIPRRGYRFIAPVKEADTETLQPAETASMCEATAEIPGGNLRPSPMRGVALRWQFLLPIALLAATLGSLVLIRRKPALTEKDTVVLADIANSTGDAVFDDTLKQALSVQLTQSPFLNVLSDRKVGETLQLMGHSPDERVTERIALDICQRTRSTAVLAGSIANIDGEFVIGLNAVNCYTHETLAREQITSKNKRNVLAALGKAASDIRSKLGESRASLAKFDTPIDQVTTPSLEALQAYTMGRKALNNGDFTAAVLLLQKAVSLDPKFAMAYRKLGATYLNLGANNLAAESTRKAYELREHVSEREKFDIEALSFDGDLEKQMQTLELWAQTYPRDAVPHFELGNIYDVFGQYERGLAEARESLRLDPESSLNYAYLVYAYMVLNRLQEAQATAKEAQVKKLDSPSLRFTLYALAFVQNDAAGMAQQVAWAEGKPEVEDQMLDFEANTAAYFGRLGKAREFSRRAVASAERKGEGKETGAGYEAEAALREILFGNAAEARKRAAAALRLSTGRDAQFGAALTLAMAGDTTRASALVEDFTKRFPKDTVVRFNYLPTIDAQLALTHKHNREAIAALQAATPYELGQPASSPIALGLYPVYVRAEAYLNAHQGSEAAAEFQKILDRGAVLNSVGALAHLGLARAYGLQGDVAKARAAYHNFFLLWKDADTDIPILKQAKWEYAKLE
jgi:eukaryotic-like serine/threonine-protein kinase